MTELAQQIADIQKRANDDWKVIKRRMERADLDLIEFECFRKLCYEGFCVAELARLKIKFPECFFKWDDYPHLKILDDGRAAYIGDLTYGRGRINVTQVSEPDFIEDFY